MLLQVRRHGAQDAHGQDLRGRVQSVRGAGHRAARASDCEQLLPHLPAEPARRQTQGPEGQSHTSTYKDTST